MIANESSKIKLEAVDLKSHHMAMHLARGDNYELVIKLTPGNQRKPPSILNSSSCLAN
jgi:hypothetical protein